MKTNFQMLRELLEVYHPVERGVIMSYEVETITEYLCLEKMNVLGLRNMRDFVVLFLGKSDSMEDWDRMSAITSVIDTAIWNRGEEV